MPDKIVILASVPGVHISSSLSVPALLDRVAFGSSTPAVKEFPIGLDVYIYVSDPTHSLYQRGTVSWGGTLGAIVPAVESGRRSGKYPDPKIRPPTAEETDGAFSFFWEVLRLKRLIPPIPLSRFSSRFHGMHPEWPVLATLGDDARE